MRVMLLLCTLIILALFIAFRPLPFTIGLLCIGVVTITAELIYFVNHSNRELQKFMESISYGDYSVSFKGGSLGKSFRELNLSFDKLIDKLKAAEAEKQSQTELLKLTFEHIKLGLIVVDSADNIQIINQHAQELLAIPQFSKWSMLAKSKPGFAEHIADFNFEGRKLISLDEQGGQQEYYLDLQHIKLLGTPYYLLSFSDLKNEIEQKEIEAWHKLIRILAHEVMNSVTPVTSLSETLKAMLFNKDAKRNKTPEELSQEDLDDMSEALHTIVKRSSGMLSFVDEYRKLTKLPAPHFEIIKITDLLQDCLSLMKVEVEKRNISVEISVNPPQLAIKADRKMIEQSLINLISNAYYAMDKAEKPLLKLEADYKGEFTEISVKDNGKGIDEAILPSIFIPFFSTRKNGSGIGLTLIKNIMKQHQGSIHVSSKLGEGSSFKMRFKN